ncbi:MAG TPA: cupin domain-containing protein [Chlamydiales bacterium]|nr:cupin domain-containing protein [Chlamydiales bacterium]
MDVIPFEKLSPERLTDTITRRYVYGEKGMLVRFELQKGAIIPLHHHPNEQITYIVSGKVKVTIDGKDLIVSSGEVLIIPSNVAHQFEALEDTIDIDLFSPPRQDWISGDDSYFR